jgi:hypothetical protein
MLLLFSGMHHAHVMPAVVLMMGHILCSLRYRSIEFIGSPSFKSGPASSLQAETCGAILVQLIDVIGWRASQSPGCVTRRCTTAANH